MRPNNFVQATSVCGILFALSQVPGMLLNMSKDRAKEAFDAAKQHAAEGFGFMTTL